MNFSTSSVLCSAEKHLLEFPLKQLLFPVRLLVALFHFTRISFWKTKTKPNYCLPSRWTVLSQTMLMKAKQQRILISFPQTSQGKVIVQIKDHKKKKPNQGVSICRSYALCLVRSPSILPQFEERVWKAQQRAKVKDNGIFSPSTQSQLFEHVY